MKFQVVAGLSSLVTLAQGVRIKRSGQQVHISGVKVHEFRKGVEDWILLFKEGTTEAGLARTCAGECAAVGHPGKGGAAWATVRGTEKVTALLEKHGEDVELLEQERMDYLIPEIESDGPVASAASSWGLERINVAGRATTGNGVHIYVQDTGVRASHQDFGGRVIPTLDLTTGVTDGEVCGPAPTTCTRDGQGHGTHCAGSAAGQTFGVASEATVHAVKTLSDKGSGQRSWQMVAIDWVTTDPLAQRPAVISMSLGGRGSDPSYTTVINAATLAGVIVVVAAGNSNADACNFSPAFAANAITVGSTTSTDSRSSFSNFGPCTQIWGPGSNIVSASSGSDTGSTTKSGTSMACPHVSGAAALILEAFPDYKKDEVLASLLDNAVTNGISDLKAGDTNKLLYVGAGGPPPTPVPAPTPPPTTPSVCVTECQEFYSCWFGDKCKDCPQCA